MKNKRSGNIIFIHKKRTRSKSDMAKNVLYIDTTIIMNYSRSNDMGKRLVGMFSK